MSKGITGGRENLFVTEPLKSYKYHYFIPKKRFYIIMKYYVLLFFVTVNAPYTGVSKLPSWRCVKYSGRHFLKVMNYLCGILLITIRSLNDLINAAPLFPPVFIQA